MTNLVMWALAGGIIGWIGYSYMNLNEKRGVMVSIVIGMLGGFLGGELLAPMFWAQVAWSILPISIHSRCLSRWQAPRQS